VDWAFRARSANLPVAHREASDRRVAAAGNQRLAVASGSDLFGSSLL
jgi:seryl-tRNA(Sec) selenium transferase